LDSLQKRRRAAVIAAIVAIPFEISALRHVGQEDKLAGIATASAAATARGCHFNRTDISRLVEQYRDQQDVGWAESGSKVAQDIDNNCIGSGAVAPSSH
jgi:hypothetical protein